MQSKDFNVVQLNGLPALSPTDLSPVAIQLVQPNAVDPWFDVVADFMVGWADEFHVEHRSENQNLTPGFAKAYGGALTVSVFDTNPTPAQEGVGTEVNPFVEQLIGQTKKVQVENTVGLKRFTFRFRAKQGSGYFVDCPVEVNVTATACPPCDPPEEADPPPDEDEPCVYFNPAYIPPSVPGEQILLNGGIAGSDPGGGEPLVPYSLEGISPVQYTAPLVEPIYSITIQGQAVGANPTILVRRWTFSSDTTAQNNLKLTFVDEKEYIPFLVSGATCPTNAAPYTAAQAYRIGLSVSQETVDNIILYEIFIKDGELVSKPQAMLGPGLNAASFQIMPGVGIDRPTLPI